MTPDSEVFYKILKNSLKNASEEQIQKIVRLRELVLEENKVQNLTKLTTPEDFFDGHVVDADRLTRTDYITPGTKVIDAGTGLGSPGLIAAILMGGNWVLCDSEKSKASFVEKAAEALGLMTVKASSARVESLVMAEKPTVVVSKALGKVQKVYSYIKNCSTWNTLILFKGPKWEEEWKEFLQDKIEAKKLKIEKIIEYTVGKEQKNRKIVILRRE